MHAPRTEAQRRCGDSAWSGRTGGGSLGLLGRPELDMKVVEGAIFAGCAEMHARVIQRLLAQATDLPACTEY